MHAIPRSNYFSRVNEWYGTVFGTLFAIFLFGVEFIQLASFTFKPGNKWAAGREVLCGSCESDDLQLCAHRALL